MDLSKVHYLSGPFGVQGAEPGDLLVVDLLDIGYLPDSPWGFTGIFAKENGGGFRGRLLSKGAQGDLGLQRNLQRSHAMSRARDGPEWFILD